MMWLLPTGFSFCGPGGWAAFVDSIILKVPAFPQEFLADLFNFKVEKDSTRRRHQLV